MSQLYIKENIFNEIIENINKRIETIETNNEETRKQNKDIINIIEKSNNNYITRMQIHFN